MIINEIEKTIIEHLRRYAMRCDLVVYVSDALRDELIDSCAAVTHKHIHTFRKESKSVPEMILGCEMRTIKDMHEPFSVVHRKHLGVNVK